MAMTDAERQRAYQARHSERAKANWKRYSLSPKGTATLLLNYAKDRARRQGLAFELDKEWLDPKLETNVCEFTGLPLKRVAMGRRVHDPFGPSLDRIDPSLGYTKSNTRLVCFIVNTVRHDWGDDVLITIASAIVQKHITK